MNILNQFGNAFDEYRDCVLLHVSGDDQLRQFRYKKEERKKKRRGKEEEKEKKLLVWVMHCSREE